MSAHDQVPEHLKEYFGHDKVALFGSGGMPAAPPAPPGSPARRQGEAALADALSKVGTPGPRIGGKPAARPPRPALPRLMRSQSERALMEHSMRRLAPRAGMKGPHQAAGAFWRLAFVPFYSRLPWSVKQFMVKNFSGVKGWFR